MNLTNLISGPIGLVHLIASLLAMLTGMFVLLTTKGTTQHKKVGYWYAASMLTLNLTAFMIYRLYGKFAIFHWLAVVSCLTLFAGLYPIFRRTGSDYLLRHFSFMYWSVIGLYAAFMAETFVRLPRLVLRPDGSPNTIFYKMVGYAVGLTLCIGVFCFIKLKPKWKKQFRMG